jgi:hypothetical protein
MRDDRSQWILGVLRSSSKETLVMRLSLMRFYVAVVPVGLASAVALAAGVLRGWKW